ncbi:MAG: bifunctional DNA-formamidopyrimidine glycosylase/DNA-(apurinic or apyrimidinic site) lyase [Planctomycetes bacterium]|nr:bifunctional DNA-formamidopyrimidine glycosylase/DNA-(apurinic or apyrimidinic site) lyase [Planctomycetota bacterium]
MPELPEVETTRAGIAPHVIGRTITGITVRNNSLRYKVPATMARKAKSQVVRALTRRSKYLIFQLDDLKLLVHLGMSGSLRYHPPCAKHEAPKKHDHIDVRLDDGGLLRYHDPRRFGLWLPFTEDVSEHRLLSHLGPEPLTRDFSAKTFIEKSKKRSIGVKAFIMDAKVVVGVGNIYAAESLFMSKISPLRPANAVSDDEYKLLVKNIKIVLRKSIKRGGTTLNDFVGSDGKPGYFQQKLLVYGREGQKCVSCTSVIANEVIGQRASCYCPKCQK